MLSLVEAFIGFFSRIPYCHLLKEETSPDYVMAESRNQNSKKSNPDPQLRSLRRSLRSLVVFYTFKGDGHENIIG